MAIVFCGSKTKEIMTDLPFSRVLKVFFHDRYSAIGDVTASNENEEVHHRVTILSINDL